MAQVDKKTVKIIPEFGSDATKHTIKAAKVLYSAPDFVLRGPVYLIFLILFTIVLYSFWAKKDIIVVAPLVLAKKSVTVESIGNGQVIDVRVAANSDVNSNDVLLLVQEKIRAIMDTEHETFDSRIQELQKERDKLIDEYDHTLAQLHLEFEDLKQNRGTKKITLLAKITQLKEKLKTTARERALREKEYKTSLSRYARAKKRFDNRDITISQFEAIEQEMDRRKKAVEDARSTISELTVLLRTTESELGTLTELHSLERIGRQIKHMESRQDREVKRLIERIASVRDKKVRSQQLVEGVSFKDTLTEYKSTFDGLVTRVHVHKGQIISPGTSLVTIVKDTAVLEGRTLVQNKDIGKIKIGQTVQIKYFAYPHQEYGIPKGVIVDIAKRPSEIEGQESKYLVRIALEKEVITMIGGRKRHPLEIGLEGVAEIKSDEKRWIELVFTPVSRFFTQDDE
jgi:multidrug resistance efflux pump